MCGKPGGQMAGRRLEGGARIRRATRHDLPAVLALMGPAAASRSERFDRRGIRRASEVVAVVEDAEGTVRGAMALAFVRSFGVGGWQAHLDGLWIAPGSEALADGMVEAACDVAARRHCHALFARGPLAPFVQAALERRGALAMAGVRVDVTPAAHAPVARGRRRRA
jgi:hypothetical protein